MRGTISLVLLKALGCLPLGINRLLGRLVGTLYWHCSKKVRHISQVNLSLCFPEKSVSWQRKTAKSGIINMAVTLLESPVLWRMSAAQLLELCENPEDFAPLYQAQDQGDGVVVSTPHLGNWELSGLLYAIQRPLTALYRPPKITAVDTFIRDGRQTTGATLVPTTGRGVKALTRALLSGTAIGILPDQEANPDNGVFTPYFATQAYTMTLLPKLAQRRNSPVFLIYLARPNGTDQRKYRVHVQKIEDAIYDEDISTACSAMNNAIEEMIRHNPGQYNWAYKRFNQTPGVEEKYREYKN